jgi:hypothetical protein
VVISRIEIGDQQAVAGAELRMPDEGTAQGLRSALGALGARHPGGQNPPPRAGRRTRLPCLEAARQARLLDHDQAVTDSAVVTDRDPQWPRGRDQRLRRAGLGRPSAAGPVLIGERIAPVGRRGDGADEENPPAAASGGRRGRRAEAEQVKVAVRSGHRRAEHLLPRQRQPGAAAEHGRWAQQAGRRVVLGHAESFRGQRVPVPGLGDAVIVVGDEQGARRGGRRAGNPGDPRGRVGAGARAGQHAAR